ncbi:MAG: Hpt domain-containing protein [Agathobacter sp.]|nr:Hpt domain-containing protein [Agathobacter sp.]
MTLKECYESFGGNYETAKRQMVKEDIIHRFVLKFPEDKSYTNLIDAVNAQNYQEAFKAAHTLKGVCLNLSFERLSNSVSMLTEFLRNKKNDEVDKFTFENLLQAVIWDYNEVISSICSYSDSNII